MELNQEQVGGVLVIQPEGRLDSVSSPEFEQQVLQLLEKHGRLIIRFAGLQYISSAGLRVLLSAAKQVRRQQGRLVLCEIDGPIREVFEISGFLSILEVCDDLDAALRQIEG